MDFVYSEIDMPGSWEWTVCGLLKEPGLWERFFICYMKIYRSIDCSSKGTGKKNWSKSGYEEVPNGRTENGKDPKFMAPGQGNNSASYQWFDSRVGLGFASWLLLSVSEESFHDVVSNRVELKWSPAFLFPDIALFWLTGRNVLNYTTKLPFCRISLVCWANSAHLSHTIGS